jgi:hypothetical protein
MCCYRLYLAYYSSGPWQVAFARSMIAASINVNARLAADGGPTAHILSRITGTMALQGHLIAIRGVH